MEYTSCTLYPNIFARVMYSTHSVMHCNGNLTKLKGRIKGGMHGLSLTQNCSFRNEITLIVQQCLLHILKAKKLCCTSYNHGSI